MMTQTLKDMTARLLEVNAVIEQLDSGIRPLAFPFFEDYIRGDSPPAKSSVNKQREAETSDDRETFFSKFTTDRPADNALLLTAYWYSQYGVTPFSSEELKALSVEVGLIVPDRIDMTVRNAQRDGKSLFQSVGKGRFRPTVHGEIFFKASYKVAKGRRQIEQSSAEA